jgi:hypothetical protein
MLPLHQCFCVSAFFFGGGGGPAGSGSAMGIRTRMQVRLKENILKNVMLLIAGLGLDVSLLARTLSKKSSCNFNLK